MSYNSKYKGSEVEELLDSIGNKVDKVDGKQLSTEDFTTLLKQKLDGLSNYDDTAIQASVSKLRTDLDTLVSGDTTTAIKTFNEVIAFLDGLEDTEDLASIIASIERQVASKQDTLVSGTNIKTINGESILGEGDLTIEGGAKVYTWNWDGSESGTLTQEEYDGIKDADMVFVSVSDGDFLFQKVVTEYVIRLMSVVAVPDEGSSNVIADAFLIQIDPTQNAFAIFYHAQGENIIPTKTSQLENDSKFVSSNGLKTINGESIVGSGDIVIEGGSSSGSGAYAEVSHGTSDTTFTLTPNTFHVWDEVASLDLSFGDETAGVANEYLFQFTSGTTATTLTLPSTVVWADDDVPTIESGYTYVVSIMKNLAVYAKF